MKRIIDQARELAVQWEQLQNQVEALEDQLGELFRVRPPSLEEAERELAELEATIPEDERSSQYVPTAMGKWAYYRCCRLRADFIPQLRRMRTYETEQKSLSRAEREAREQELDEFARNVLGIERRR